LQGVSFIVALSTAPLSPRWCAYAETYRDRCGAQDTEKRNALFGWRELLYLVRFNFYSRFETSLFIFVLLTGKRWCQRSYWNSSCLFIELRI